MDAACDSDTSVSKALNIPQYERRKKGAWKLLEACDMHEMKKQGCHMLAVQQWQMAWAGPCCKLAMVG